MDTVYLVCAVVGGTLIVCQFLATMLGLGGHHDLGGGHDMPGDVGGHDFGGHDAGGHDAGGHDGSGHDGSGHDASHHDSQHHSASSWIFTVLTFRTLTAFFAFFGLAGIAAKRLELEPAQILAVALVSGAVALFIVAWLMRMLFKLNVDGTVRIERAVGTRGTVYLSIPAAKSGVGKVHVSQLNRTVEDRRRRHRQRRYGRSRSQHAL
jgi:membrane protein implicated in regulation of membrane protease activity